MSFARYRTPRVPGTGSKNTDCVVRLYGLSPMHDVGCEIVESRRRRAGPRAMDGSSVPPAARPRRRAGAAVACAADGKKQQRCSTARIVPTRRTTPTFIYFLPSATFFSIAF